MYYAPTINMMRKEDKMLKIAMSKNKARHNVHKISNAPESPGYVYVIVGNWFKRE